MNGERMVQRTDIDPTSLVAKIHESPVKALGEITLSQDALAKQASYITESAAVIDYETVRGTCGDERERIGLRSGEAVVEPRPSVFGGPNIYGLYVAELAGVFKGSQSSPTERLRQVTRDLNRNKVASGGHEHCAAAAGFGDKVLPNIVANQELIRSYATSNKEDYDEEIMNEVFANATAVVEARTYAGWDGETALLEVLENEAGESVERLADVPHEGRTFVRTKRPNTTVDQSRLHSVSGGEDSFVHDDAYADRIENALASGPEAAKMKRLMEHAREAVLVGVALSVPNPELHQIDLK